jgi:copper resistance protein B
MSTSRILALAAALAALGSAAAAQTPAATDQPAAMPGMLPGGAVQPVMDREIFAHLFFSELEGRFNGSSSEFRWEGQGWVGTDYDKLWIKSEGTLQGNGTLDDGQHQFLYSRAITTYFDLQGGLRSDIDSRPTRNWGALGIQGLAPYFFDLELTGYASGEGHLAAKLEASYDLLLTQRLILQPQVELNVYSKADPARMVGAGFSDIDTGLRLRYEIDRKFAPYIGVVYEGKFRQTANFARRAGESTGDVRFVLGIRTWF